VLDQVQHHDDIKTLIGFKLLEPADEPMETPSPSNLDTRVVEVDNSASRAVSGLVYESGRDVPRATPNVQDPDIARANMAEHPSEGASI
jgi:hypothetical protein